MVKKEKGGTIAIALLNKLRIFMKSGDSPGAVAATTAAISEKSLSIENLYLDCLVPLLTGIGEEWQTHELSVWREHVASAICRDIIGSMAPEIARVSAKPNGKTIVLACPPEEQHDIGLRMYADLFRIAGWQAYFLGADVPVAEIISAAASTGADSILLNSATHFDLINADDVIDEISTALPEINILLAGPAYKGENPWPAKAKLFDPATLSKKAGRTA